MNFSEITETSVNELTEDGSEQAEDDGQFSTEDYLELLLKKNKIPRTNNDAPLPSGQAQDSLQSLVKLNVPLKKKDMVESPASPRLNI